MHLTPRTRRTAAAALLLGPLAYLSGDAVSAAAWSDPAYSYLDNWISDLGSSTSGTFQGRVIDSPLSWVMNAGFVTQGLLLALGLLLLSRALPVRLRRTLVAVTVATTVGYLLLAAFEGSAAAAESGTLALHFVGATLAILGVNAVPILLGVHWRKGTEHRRLGLAGILLGATGLVAVVLLFATFGTGAPAGLIERMSVYPGVAWQVLTAVALLTASRTDPRPATASSRVHAAS